MVENRVRTDDEMAAIDVASHIRAGLVRGTGHDAAALRGDGAISAAITADRIGVRARPLAFLAEFVRRGGRAAAVGLTDPLPTAEQAVLARSWLEAAAEVPGGADLDEAMARWLETVADLVAMRRGARGLER